MKKLFVLALVISVVFVLSANAIQIGPTEKCTKISTILYKSFLTSNDEVTSVEIKLVTEDRRGEDIDVYARKKHYELCDILIKKGWQKKSFEVQEEMEISGNYVLLMKSDFECEDKNWDVDKRGTDIILGIDGDRRNPKIKFFNYLYNKDELWNKKIQRKKDDKKFFNEMVVWVEDTIKRTFNLE